MLSDIARKMLHFTLFFLCLVPWFGEIFIFHTGNIVFMFMVFVWMAMALLVFGISDGLKNVIKNTWLIIIPGSLVSAALIPYFIYWLFYYYFNIGIVNAVVSPFSVYWSDSFLSTALRIITLIIWMSAYGISLFDKKPADERFHHRESIFAGLLILVLYAMFFPQSKTIVYICFAGYIFLVILWILRWDNKNSLTSLSLVGGIFAGVSLIIVMQDAFITFFAWIYHDLSLTLSSIVTRVYMKNTEAFDREAERLLKIKVTQPPRTPQPTFKIKTNYDNPTWDAIQPYVNWTLMIIFVIVIIYILYRRKKRLKIPLKENEKNKRAIIESITDEYHIAEQIATKVKRVMKRLKSDIFATTREGKIRMMYRRIMQKMKQRAFPETSTKTPLEVMKLFPDCKEVVPIYNKVRYGEKKVAPDEYERAEQNFKQVMEEFKSELYMKKKKNSEQ